MDIISAQDLSFLKRFSKNRQRFFDSGVQAIGVAPDTLNANQVWTNFTLEEDEILHEIGLFIGVDAYDTAADVLEGAVDVANVPASGIAQLANYTNPVIYAMKDFHEHVYVAGAAGGWGFLWNGWERFQFNEHKWILNEEDVVYLNYHMVHSVGTTGRNAQIAAYILTSVVPNKKKY